MSLIAKETKSSGSFALVPAGMHLARCYRIIDLGTQPTKFGDKHQVMIQFEVHGEDDEGNPLLTPNGDPLSISKTYTNSLNEASTLSAHLESWRGVAFTPAERKGFDLQKILGIWGMVTVVHSTSGDKQYANIDGINPVPAAIKKHGLPEAVNETKSFDIDKPDMELLESLGKYTKDKIMSSPEWNSKGKKSVDDDKDPFDDDIDF
jgi:hypothetical protein